MFSKAVNALALLLLVSLVAGCDTVTEPQADDADQPVSEPTDSAALPEAGRPFQFEIEIDPRTLPEDLQAGWEGAGDGPWAVGDTAVYRWDGSEWEYVVTIPRTSDWMPRALSISGTEQGIVYISGTDGRVYRWNGSDLTALPQTAKDAILGSVWARSDTEIYVADESTDRILRYDGTKWSDVFWPRVEGSRYIVDLEGVGDVAMVLSSGLVHRLEDGKWERIEVIRDCACLRDLWMASDSFGVVVGRSGATGTQALIYGYDGREFTEMEVPQAPRLAAVWGSAEDRIFAVGTAGTILHYDGVRWHQMESGTEEALAGVFGSGDRVFATGNYGLLLSLEDGVWKRVNYRPWLEGVWGDRTGFAAAVGSDGTIMATDGDRWVVQSSPTNTDLSDVWGSSPSDLFAVGDNGTIVHFDGQSWTLMESGTTARLASIWGRASTEIYAAGTGGTLLRYNGAVWTAIPTGTTAPMLAISDDPQGNLLIAGGSQLFSYDGAVVTPIAPSGLGLHTYTDMAPMGDTHLLLGWTPRQTDRYSDPFFGALEGDSIRAFTIPEGSPWTLAPASPDRVFATYNRGTEPVELLVIEGDRIQRAGRMVPGDNARGIGFQDIWAISENEIIAVGSSSAIVRGRN